MRSIALLTLVSIAALVLGSACGSRSDGPVAELDPTTTATDPIGPAVSDTGEMKKLTASDAQAVDGFGGSVAISGDTAVVGACCEGLDAGAAYVFHRTFGGSDNWGEVAKLTASDATAEDFFGSSVAISGDTIVVGAYLEDAAGDAAGAAYVFQRDAGGTGSWSEVKKLTAADAQDFDLFGASVAISGDTVVVGAYLESAEGTIAGAAHVFDRDAGGANNWGEVAKLTASDAAAGAFFGFSVAVSGDTAIVGARAEDTSGTDAGAAYVYERNEGGTASWGEVKKLTASDAEAGDFFGASVSVSGDTAVVGAYLGDAGGDMAGAAYVFQRDEGSTANWGEVTKLTASDGEALDRFGGAVSVSGDTAVVGACCEGPRNSAGAVYVFQRDEGGANHWGEVAKLTAYDAAVEDFFGGSVAVTSDTTLVGAAGEGFAGRKSGAAYVAKMLGN